MVTSLTVQSSLNTLAQAIPSLIAGLLGDLLIGSKIIQLTQE